MKEVRYTKPKLTKHSQLRNITFSEEIVVSGPNAADAHTALHQHNIPHGLGRTPFHGTKLSSDGDGNMIDIGSGNKVNLGRIKDAEKTRDMLRKRNSKWDVK